MPSKNKPKILLQNIWLELRKAVPLHSQKRKRHALLAQLVEQLTLNQWVQGSNP